MYFTASGFKKRNESTNPEVEVNESNHATSSVVNGWTFCARSGPKQIEHQIGTNKMAIEFAVCCVHVAKNYYVLAGPDEPVGQRLKPFVELQFVFQPLRSSTSIWKVNIENDKILKICVVVRLEAWSGSTNHEPVRTTLPSRSNISSSNFVCAL